MCCGRNVGGLAEGVKPGVSLAAGAFCEFALAFVLNLAILYSMSEFLPLHSANRCSLLHAVTCNKQHYVVTLAEGKGPAIDIAPANFECVC